MMLANQIFWSMPCILFLAAFLWLHKDTVFGISFKRQNFGGTLILFEVVVFILPAVVIISTVDVSSYAQARNTHLPEAKVVSAIIFYALFMFLLTTKFCSMVFKRSFAAGSGYKDGLIRKDHIGTDDRRIIRFLFALILSGLIVLGVGMVVWGIKHAVLMAILNHGDLLTYRLANNYATSVPGPVLSYFNFVAYAIAVVAGSDSLDENVILRWAAVFSSLFFATFMGGKALPLRCIILLCLSYVSFHRFQFTLRRILIVLLAGILLVVVAYWMFSLQYKDVSFDWLKKYLFLRLGIGQMLGTYEQFALELRNMEYIWHSIPFASFFVDYPIHAKDLMVISENVADPTRTGVKNSFFISEALAMGGYPLVLISPVIFGMSYAMGFLLFDKIMRVFGVSQFKKILFLIYVSLFPLTGDFSSFVFFKGLLLLLIMMMFCWAVYLVLKMILVATEFQKKTMVAQKL
jgi:hypothetical protein